MNLIARRTETSLRAAAQRALRAEPAAWSEFKRRRQRVKPLVWKGFALLGRLLGPAVSLLCLQRAALHARAGWAALFLFLGVATSVAMLMKLTQQRLQHLHRLPIADRDLFRVIWRDFLWIAGLSLPGFWCLFHWLIPHGNRSDLWLPAGAALLLTCAMVASLCMATAWMRAVLWAPLVQSVAWIALMCGQQACGDNGTPWLRDAMDQCATLVRLATPPGWVVTWFIEHGNGEAQATLWLVPVAISFGAGWSAWQNLRDTFVVAELAPTIPQMTPVQAMLLKHVAGRNELAVPHLHGATAIEESLKAREFLAVRPRLAAGWLDQLIWHRLTERERTLLDFMLLVRPRWAWLWRRGVMLAAGGLLMSLMLREARPDIHWLAAALGGLMLLVMALPMSNGFSRAFGLCPVAGGAPMTFVGCLPISYGEVFWLDWKVSLIRAFVALPAVLAFGTLFAWHIHVAPWLGTVVALKVFAGVLILRPLMVTLHFSAGTNDSQLSKLRGWVMLGAVLLTAIANVTLGILTVILSGWWNGPVLLLLALWCWGFHRLHRRCYDRMGFDLQPSTLLGQHPVG